MKIKDYLDSCVKEGIDDCDGGLGCQSRTNPSPAYCKNVTALIAREVNAIRLSPIHRGRSGRRPFKGERR